MSRRLLLAALAVFAAVSAAGCGHRGPRPNIVLVVVDTLRQDHLATYGYARDTAPFLGALARQGVVFDGLSPSSWTKPATASLLTGLHPLRHQAFARRDRLPDGVVTLAERLQRIGYRTVGASANGWVSPVFGFDRGFDTFLFRDNVRAVDLDRELVGQLAGLKPPFFLYLHLIDPHLPYDPPTAWDGGPLPERLRGRPLTLAEADATHFRQRPPEVMARARDLYDGEIREADRGIETVVRWLDGRGLMKDTVLIATADHGEELGEHGRMSHGQTLYQEVVRVPLIVHAPGRFRGGRRFGRASLLDVVPTLADLLDLRAPGLDGVSLAGQLSGGPAAAISDTAALPDRSFLLHLDFRDGVSLALLRGGKKLLLGQQPYRKELFDLTRDPGERHDLVAAGGDADFTHLGSELADRYAGYLRAAQTRVTVPIADGLMRRLAGLGYINVNAAPGPRWIPRRIEPPDPIPGGRLGWERPSSPEGCVRLAEPGSGHALLAGWYDAEAGGRWTAPVSSLAVPLTEGWRSPTALVVSGANYRPAPVRLRVSVERHAVLDVRVPPGGFQLRGALAGLSLSRPLLVEIAADPPFVPAAAGIGADARSLGVFLMSVCAGSG